MEDSNEETSYFLLMEWYVNMLIVIFLWTVLFEGASAPMLQVRSHSWKYCGLCPDITFHRWKCSFHPWKTFAVSLSLHCFRESPNPQELWKMVLEAVVGGRNRQKLSPIGLSVGVSHEFHWGDAPTRWSEIWLQTIICSFWVLMGPVWNCKHLLCCYKKLLLWYAILGIVCKSMII